MILAGIDYSMSCPAIAIYDTSKTLEFDNIKFLAISSGAKKYIKQWGTNITIVAPLEHKSPEERYKNLASTVISCLNSNNVSEVVLEGYSMGSSSGLVFNIAENTSVLKQMLYGRGIKFITPAPTAVKKNYTGKGNAKKDLMCEEFYKRFGVKPHQLMGSKQYDTPENDLVDAVANLLMHPHFNKDVSDV